MKPSFEVEVIPGVVLPMVNVDYYDRKILELPYANLSPTQTLDIYLPVIVCIHGGAFTFNSDAFCLQSESFAHVAKDFWF